MTAPRNSSGEGDDAVGVGLAAVRVAALGAHQLRHQHGVEHAAGQQDVEHVRDGVADVEQVGVQLVADGRGEQHVAEVAAGAGEDRAGRHHRGRREDAAALGGVAHGRRSRLRLRRAARARRTRRVSRTAIAANSRPTPAPMITQIRPLTCSARIGNVVLAARAEGAAVGAGQLEGDRVHAALVGGGVEQDAGLAVRRELDRLAAGDLEVGVGPCPHLDRDRHVQVVADEHREAAGGAGQGHRGRRGEADVGRGCRGPTGSVTRIRASATQRLLLGGVRRVAGDLLEQALAQHVVVGEHRLQGAAGVEDLASRWRRGAGRAGARRGGRLAGGRRPAAWARRRWRRRTS